MPDQRWKAAVCRWRLNRTKLSSKLPGGFANVKGALRGVREREGSSGKGTGKALFRDVNSLKETDPYSISKPVVQASGRVLASWKCLKPTHIESPIVPCVLSLEHSARNGLDLLRTGTHPTTNTQRYPHHSIRKPIARKT